MTQNMRGTQQEETQKTPVAAAIDNNEVALNVHVDAEIKKKILQHHQLSKEF
jgi:hypothetical protein